jgi:hypothetical protein
MKLAHILVVVLIGLLLALFRPVAVVHSIDPADYQWKFWVGGLRIYVQYPEECHAGDSITYNILIYSSQYSQGNYVEEIKVTISVPISQTEFARLYEAWIYQHMLMPNGNEYSKTVTVTVPQNSWWKVALVLDVSTYSGDMQNHVFSNLGLDATPVMSKTWSDLMSENIELFTNYTSLKWEHDSYTSFHTIYDSEYNALNSTYNQYTQSHSYTNTEYTDLQSSLNQSTSYNNMLTILVIVLILLSLGSIGSTVFFVTRRPKTKPL